MPDTPIGLTGKNARAVFVTFVAFYNFQQSIENNPTVSLQYENRTPEPQHVNADLNDQF